MLGKLIQFPGLKFGDLFPGVEVEGPIFVYVDIGRGNNCFCWLLARRTIRCIGENFYRRGLGYIGICVAWSIGASLAINFLVWFQIKHHLATLIGLCIGIFGVMGCSMSALNRATELQGMIPAHRLILKRKLVGLNQEIIQQVQKDNKMNAFGREAGVLTMALKAWRGADEDKSFTRLKCLHDLVQSIEEAIRYEEEEVDPVQIFGAVAGPGLASAIFGTVIGLLTLAFQQISATNFSEDYREDGWYIPG